MKNGYYFFRTKSGNKQWRICMVYNGYVHFFGEVSQKLGNEYLTKYVEFGNMIEIEDEEE